MTIKMKLDNGDIKTIQFVVACFIDEKGFLNLDVVGRKKVKVLISKFKCVGIYDYD